MSITATPIDAQGWLPFGLHHDRRHRKPDQTERDKQKTMKRADWSSNSVEVNKFVDRTTRGRTRPQGFSGRPGP